ncbi:MAG: NUDIX hydrolase [Lysobacteraceae bacterium]
MNDSSRFAPHLTVATVVARQGKLLFVEEHSAHGSVLNQPAGHLEADETLQQAAVRETLEETGWTVRLSALIGLYQWNAPDGEAFVRVAFAAEPVSHDSARQLDEGIVRTLWLSPAELKAEIERHRSPLVQRVVEDYLGGSRHPLQLARSLL